MPKRRRRKVRRCSFCRRSGHNRQTCPEDRSVVIEEKLQTVVQETFETSPNKGPVIIGIKREKITSPHVIDLRSQNSNSWDSVKVYKELDSSNAKEKPVLESKELVEPKILTKNNTLEIKQEDLKPKISLKKEESKAFKIPTYSPVGVESLSKKEILKTAQPKVKIKKKKFSLIHELRQIKNAFLDGVKNIFALPKNAILGILETPKIIAKAVTFKKGFAIAFLLIFAIGIPLPAIGYYKKLQSDKNSVVEASTNAFLALQSSMVAAFSSNIDQAQYDLGQALTAFDTANSIIEKDYQTLTAMIKFVPVLGSQVTARQHILKAAHSGALGNTYIVKGLKEVQEQANLPFTDRIKILSNHLKSALPQFEEAQSQLALVKESAIPVEYQESFHEFKTILFSTFLDDMKDLVDLSQTFQAVAGGDDLKRYLVVFQNNHEVRPTGGFIGSIALVDVQKGRITNIEIPPGGSYDLQGQYTEHIVPPAPLQLLNKRWEFQDANWSPHFPASAEKLMHIYEDARGTTVDGVIAINANVLERLLRVLGPIGHEKLGEVDEKNILASLQYEVEVDYDEKDKPKKVIAELFEMIVDELTKLETVDMIHLLTEMHEAVSARDIQVFSIDQKTQKIINDFGVSGEIISTENNQDYLSVVDANIGGLKSNACIRQDIDHQSVIQEDGSIENTVIIRRKHVCGTGEDFYAANNVSFLRLYVPEGAKLIEAAGFTQPGDDIFKVPESYYEDDPFLSKWEKEIGYHIQSGTRITNEFGKTAFGNWVMTAPGKESEVYFTYVLPQRVNVQFDDQKNTVKDFLIPKKSPTIQYQLLFQKQSGVESDFQSTVIFPNGWVPIWKSNEDVKLATNGGVIEEKAKNDVVFGIIMQREEIK